MYVVAICELAGSVEAEAAALAADLGTTAYEERLGLVAGTPAIVLTTGERERAVALLKSVRARGHGAIAFDARSVVPSEAMVSMRIFELAANGIVAREQPGNVDVEVPWDDVLAIFRASHKTRTDGTVEVKKREFALGRALLSGGVLPTKMTKKTEVARTEVHEQVMYLFRRSGETPLLLRERSANYATLGAAMSPSAAQSFLKTVERVRAACPSAVYDDRLLAPRAVSGKIARISTLKSTIDVQSSAPAVDLLAHTLALWARRAAAPSLG